MREFIIYLLRDKMPEERTRQLATLLIEGRWTHDYPITFEKARELGLPVTDEMPPEVYELMELYPQAPNDRPGVEYIPHPFMPGPGKTIPGRQASEACMVF